MTLWTDDEIEVTVANTIVQGDCATPLASLGGNVESATSTCGFSHVDDQSNVASSDLALADPAANGGPTLTLAPRADSVAIDAGVNSECAAVDQRGVSRPEDGDGNGNARCDSEPSSSRRRSFPMASSPATPRGGRTPCLDRPIYPFNQETSSCDSKLC